MNRYFILIYVTVNLLTGSFAQINYEAYYFTTVAGDLAGKPGSSDGRGAEARFNSPGRLSIDSQGNVFVADSGNHLIRKVTPLGLVMTIAGSPGQKGTNDGVGSEARFNLPFGTAPDGQGNIYVADYGNHLIRKISPLGVVTTVAGVPGSGMEVDGAGANARFNGPVGITVHSSGTVLIADIKGNTIRKMTPAGEVTTIVGLEAQLNGPSGIAEAPDGSLFIVDQSNHVIRKMSPQGELTIFAGTFKLSGIVDATGTAAKFYFPTSLGVDRLGNVFVADNSNRLIRKITPGGVVTTLGGRHLEVGRIDGQGWEARFFGPTGIAVDSNGDLHICDYFNHTIRKGSALYISPITPPAAFTDGRFTFSYSSRGLDETVIEASTDLVRWSPIATNAPAGYAPFTDAASDRSGNRFYRLRN